MFNTHKERELGIRRGTSNMRNHRTEPLFRKVERGKKWFEYTKGLNTRNCLVLSVGGIGRYSCKCCRNIEGERDEEMEKRAGER